MSTPTRCDCGDSECPSCGTIQGTIHDAVIDRLIDLTWQERDEFWQQNRERRAVDCFNRSWAPVAEKLAEAQECDAHFDGGEWSGPAHDSIWQKQHDQMLDTVAEAFGMTPDDLSAAIWSQSMAEEDQRRTRVYVSEPELLNHLLFPVEVI